MFRIDYLLKDECNLTKKKRELIDIVSNAKN